MKLCLVFNHFEKEHLGKDVFLTPYYLAKQYGYELEIVYRQTKTNRQFPKSYRGVQLTPLKTHFPFYHLWYFEWLIISCLYLRKNAKSIDVLMCFHVFFRTLLQTHVYKTYNFQGKVYVKMDLPQFIINKLKIREKSRFWNFLYKRFCTEVSCCSIETTDCFKALRKVYPFSCYVDKFVFMPNGFDRELSVEMEINPLQFDQKKNIMITVGRIGTQQKNTELLLEILGKIDIKEWKIYIIGNIEDKFKIKISQFFKTYPHLKNSVYFTGAITDKKELWSYFQMAKVFLLTSIWESYGLVLNEAVYFHDYVVTSDVGAARDILQNKYGSILPLKSSCFEEKLQAIIDGSLDINVYNKYDDSSIIWEKLVNKIKL